MKLKDTVSLMLSDDYHDRFVAEVAQLKIRIEKLAKELAKEDVCLTCNVLMETQLHAMQTYLDVLVARGMHMNIESDLIELFKD